MSDEVRSFYDDFASRQIEQGVNLRHHKIMEWLLRSGLRDGIRVLEIGCGVGTQTALIAGSIPNGKLIANDISPKSVEHARERLAGRNNVEFITGNIVQLEIPGQFDLIVLPDVLEHIPVDEHGSLFLKIGRLLKPDGQVVIHIPAPQYLEWNIEHRPELLQVIDQPLHLERLLPHVASAGLYLQFAEHYGLWTDGPDAAVLVLKHYRNDLAFKLVPPPVGRIGRWRRSFAKFRGKVK